MRARPNVRVLGSAEGQVGKRDPSRSQNNRWKNREGSCSRRQGAGRDRDQKRLKNYRGRSPQEPKDSESTKRNYPVGNKDDELKKVPK